jgi:hypothetical protein
VQPPYEDRLIDGGALPPLLGDDAGVALHDPAGLPRRLGVELRAQGERVGGLSSSSSTWLLAHGSVDTANLGSISLDAGTRLHDSGTAQDMRPAQPASFSLVQRRMPFDGGWTATHGIGLVGTGSVDLIARQTRFGVPTRTVLGAAGEWSQEPQGLLLMAATGEPVLGDLIGQGGYTPLGGRDSVAGARWQPSPGWSVAGQWASHRPGTAQDDTRLKALGALPGPASDGVVAALRLEDQARFAQLNLLSTQDSTRPRHTGGWMDAGWDDGAVEHRGGLHWLPERQQWLGTPVASGSSGGYYRWRWRSRQWLAEAQVDHLRTSAEGMVPGGPPLTQAWGSLRYQWDLESAYGLQALGSEGSSRRHGFLVWREHFDERASHRLFVGIDRAQGHRSDWQLGASGGSACGETRFNGSAAVLARSGQPMGHDLALTAARELGAGASFTLGGRHFTAAGHDSSTRSLSAGLNWRLAPGWLLGLSANDSAGSQGPAQAGPSSGAPEVMPPAVALPRVRTAWLSLRYDMAEGSADAPLGGRPGAGGGSVSGTVFLDANGNGEADASDTRLAGVTVVLDERWAQRTDAQGRFEFAFVVAGEHRLRLLPDNIPLPWGFDGADTRQVSVSPRGSAVMRWGALRQ